MSEASRIAALSAAIDFRSGSMRPDEVIALARQFDEYLTAGNLPSQARRQATTTTRTSGNAPGARA